MNIREIILRALHDKGCVVQVKTDYEGIWMVHTPDGQIWDFTQPEDMTKYHLAKLSNGTKQ